MGVNNKFMVTAVISFMYAALVAFFAVTKNDMSVIKDMYLLVALWAPSPISQTKREPDGSESSINPDATASTVVTTTSVATPITTPLDPVEYK